MGKSPQDLAPAGQETSKCNMHEHTRAQSTPLPRSYSRMCSQTTTHMNITTQWAVRCVLSATFVAPSSAPTCEKALVKQRWERRRTHNLGVLQPQKHETAETETESADNQYRNFKIWPGTPESQANISRNTYFLISQKAVLENEPEATNRKRAGSEKVRRKGDVMVIMARFKNSWPHARKHKGKRSIMKKHCRCAHDCFQRTRFTVRWRLLSPRGATPTLTIAASQHRPEQMQRMDARLKKRFARHQEAES